MIKTLDLKHLAELTDNNNHTEARIYVADYFPFLGSFKNRFQKINDIHKIEGSINNHLDNYRNELTDKMFQRLSSTEEQRTVENIMNCL